MGAKIVGFILYLALSYGVIYLLVSKRYLRGWNIGESQVRAAILAAIVLIIVVGTMLVGPLPMVLLVVALVAFIDYIRSSETLAATAGDGMPDWRLLPSLTGAIAGLKCLLSMASAHRGFDRARDWRQWSSLIGSIGWLRRALTTAWAHHRFDRVRRFDFPAAQRVLAAGVTRLSAHVRSLTPKAHGKGGETSARGNDQSPTAPAPPEQPPPPAPPPLTLAEGHGLEAVRAALAPPKPTERMPTRDQAKRLLDRLEGRA
jgi:hypothetical protein